MPFEPIPAGELDSHVLAAWETTRMELAIHRGGALSIHTPRAEIHLTPGMVKSLAAAWKMLAESTNPEEPTHERI